MRSHRQRHGRPQDRGRRVVYLPDAKTGQYIFSGKGLYRSLMKIFDVSVGIYNGMPSYPGDPVPDIKRASSMPESSSNLSLMCMSTHTGTHVDPPIHFVEGGYTVDEIPPDHLYGPALVVGLPGVDVVTAAELEGVKSDIIL